MANEIYFCSRCKRWYEPIPHRHLKCCVIHGMGDCCHLNDQEVAAPPPSEGKPGQHLGHHYGPCPTSEQMGLFKKKVTDDTSQT